MYFVIGGCFFICWVVGRVFWLFVFLVKVYLGGYFKVVVICFGIVGIFYIIVFFC